MSKATAFPKRKRKTTLIIDADGILFATAVTSEMCAKKQGDNGQDLWLTTRPLEMAYGICVREIEELEAKLKADRVIICLTGPKNFRYDLLPSYKGQRTATRRPPQLSELKRLFHEREPWPVMLVEGLEADDLCGVAATTLANETTDTIICSPDKDMKQIPGWLYQKGKLTFTTEEEADRWHMYQTLVGDTADNYKGCPSVGPIKADRILADLDVADADLATGWERVFAEFTLRGETEENALTQARVSRILRASDWNAKTHEVIPWTPPIKLKSHPRS